MITFTILASIMLLLIALAVVVLVAGGTAFFAIFADLIVCAFIVFMIIKLTRKARKK